MAKRFASDAWPHSEPAAKHPVPAPEDQSWYERPAGEAATAVRFVVDAGRLGIDAWRFRTDGWIGDEPMRLRMVGSISELGTWDPQSGIDLFWEGGGRWTSVVIDVPPCRCFEFCIMRLDQPESHPGLLLGSWRAEFHKSRRFSWGTKHRVTSPSPGQVLEITLTGLPGNDGVINEWTMLRAQAMAFAEDGTWLAVPPPVGRTRIFSFDSPDGLPFNFCLYFPPKYLEAPSDEEGGQGWPLLLFLHSMHQWLDRDNNMFYESDTPLQMLLGDDRCPKALRDRFVVLSPQCPPDPQRGDGGAVWLRRGFPYESSDYAPVVEAGLVALVEAVSTACKVDRDRIAATGISMGAYACLELAAQRPQLFSAIAPVASHYDLDPIDQLVYNLTEKQTLPMWFFHAKNDYIVPYEPIKQLVDKISERSWAQVWMTSFTDTWSKQGHCADRVPYWRLSRSPEQEALGEELFTWLAEQRRYSDDHSVGTP